MRGEIKMKLMEAIEKKYSKDEPELEPVVRTTLEVKEVATYLGLSKDMIYKLVREKKMPHIKIGSRILFKVESIDRWLSELEMEGYNAAE